MLTVFNLSCVHSMSVTNSSVDLDCFLLVRSEILHTEYKCVSVTDRYLHVIAKLSSTDYQPSSETLKNTGS